MFTVFKRLTNGQPTYLPGEPGLKIGMAVTQNKTGMLIKAQPTSVPEYIVLGERSINGMYCVMRIQHQSTVFAAPCSEHVTPVVGSHVMLADDALGITSKTGGVFVVTGILDSLQPDGKAIVTGRFTTLDKTEAR